MVVSYRQTAKELLLYYDHGLLVMIDRKVQLLSMEIERTAECYREKQQFRKLGKSVTPLVNFVDLLTPTSELKREG